MVNIKTKVRLVDKENHLKFITMSAFQHNVSAIIYERSELAERMKRHQSYCHTEPLRVKIRREFSKHA